MASPLGTCPACARPYEAGQTFCAFCGTRLGAPGIPGPFPSPVATAGWTARPLPSKANPKDTITGLLLLVIAFALAWIPFVDFVGGILTLIGLIYLWTGRRELGPVHAGEVKVGVLLLVCGIVLAFAGAIALVAATFSFHISFNGTQPAVTHPPITLALEVVVAVILTAGAALAAACWMRLTYSLADATTRNLLWAAGVLDVVFAALYAVSEVQAFASVSSVFSGGTTSGPLPNPLLVGLLLAVPDLLFLVAYFQVRKRLLEGDFPGAPAVASSSQ